MTSTGGSPDPAGLAPVQRFERRAMGSPLRMLVHGVGPNVAEVAWRAASADVESSEAAMSRFRPDSELTRLNVLAGTGVAVVVGRRLRTALAASHRAWRLTNGRFDPRVLEVLDRLGYRGAPLNGRSAEQPDPSGDGETDWLACDPRRGHVTLAAPVDLGGIGKGLALRWALQAIGAGLGSQAGVLLEAGGDLVVRGPAPESGSWRVGIEDPRGGDEVAVVGIEAGAISTSSRAVHAWRDPSGRSVHHLVDPATGEPGGDGLQAVTVAGPDAAWAEVWSKALFLEGARGIGPSARSRGLAAWWITDDGVLEMTPRARQLTLWTA